MREQPDKLDLGREFGSGARSAAEGGKGRRSGGWKMLEIVEGMVGVCAKRKWRLQEIGYFYVDCCSIWVWSGISICGSSPLEMKRL